MNSADRRILLVEDSRVDQALIARLLAGSADVRFQLDHAATLDAAQQRLADGSYDVILLDLMLPDSMGLESFDRLRSKDAETPIVILTASGDEQMAVDALQHGASDFLSKADLNAKLLMRSIRYALERARMDTHRQQLQKQVLDIGRRERLRITQDLHDSIGQELTGLCMLAKSLAQKLHQHALPESDLAESIVLGIQQAISDVRDVIDGLTPVDQDAIGLQVALERLCTKTAQRTGILCRLECPLPVELSDNEIATHLFRIAQESVHNAVKYAQPAEIVVRLVRGAGETLLQVRDDGCGFEPQEETGGMGLKLMAHRSQLIGAALEISRSPSGRGTVVTCRLNHLEKRDA